MKTELIQAQRVPVIKSTVKPCSSPSLPIIDSIYNESVERAKMELGFDGEPPLPPTVQILAQRLGN